VKAALPCLILFAAACAAPVGDDAAAGGTAAPPTKGPEVLMPAPALDGVELISHLGEPVVFSSLRGKPALLTFIYTRCPMPEMCPATTLRFQEVQEALQPGQREAVRLVSISFDPAHDTPEVLSEYADLWAVDARLWLLLTGGQADIERVAAAYGVWFERGEDGNYRHPMYSMVLLPDGALHRVLLGSQWEAREIAELLARLAVEGDVTPR